MPAPHCEIKFDNNPQGIYLAGQTLSGSVVLKLDKPKRVNDFKLIINGSAEIEWSIRRTKNSHDTYRGEERLLQSVHYLLFRYGDEAIEIPAGTHIYNFACELPSSLVTSFEGKYGFIRYTASAILDRPWKFNQTFTVAFTVLKTLDLNLIQPLMKNPFKRVQTTTFCCWPCSSQPFYTTIRLPTRGFVPGQQIPITVILNNASNVKVRRINCKLNRRVSFLSQPPRVNTRIDTTTLAFITGEITDETPELFTVYLEIPPVAPTGQCSVLIIEYELLVEMCVNIFHRNPKLNIPITIGTVPFCQPASASNMPTEQPDNEEVFDNTTKLPSMQANSTAVPPSYEEAVQGLTVQVNDGPNAIGNNHYAPRYPVYRTGWSI